MLFCGHIGHGCSDVDTTLPRTRPLPVFNVTSKSGSGLGIRLDTTYWDEGCTCMKPLNKHQTVVVVFMLNNNALQSWQKQLRFNTTKGG